MTNTGTPNLIQRVLDSIEAFRAGSRSVSDLAQDLENTVVAMEGDVPREVRDVIASASRELEVESLASRDDNSSDPVERILTGVDAVIRAHYPRDPQS